MSARNLTNKKELPYIPLGPFQWRIPGIHYRIEKVEFFQGIILGATALSSIPYMTDCLGLPYELAALSSKYFFICSMVGWVTLLFLAGLHQHCLLHWFSWKVLNKAQNEYRR